MKRPAPIVAANAPTTAIWGKISGSQFNRDTSVSGTIGGTPVDIDTGLTQNTFSMLAGADFQPDGTRSGLRFGLYGAYDNSHLDFSSYGASSTYEGGSLGGYAAYTGANGFYLDAEGKADWLNLDYKGGLTASGTAASYGILANTGYRMQMGAAFLEPIVSAAYVNTSISGFDVSGATVDFSNGQSLRAGGGGRIGTVVAMADGVSAEFSVLGKVWNEFEPDNQVTITDTLGDYETFADDISGIFGEVTGTATVYTADKSFSGFVNVSDRFNSTFNEVGGKVGARRSF